jgi:hypothetical protein
LYSSLGRIVGKGKACEMHVTDKDQAANHLPGAALAHQVR